jgi:dihydroorotase
MRSKTLFISLILSLFTGFAMAQQYRIVIKGGHVIDPKNNIDGIMDIAINNGKIAAIEKNIDRKEGRQVVDASGLYVTPGLIDMHVHVFQGTQPDHQYSDGPNSVTPDGFTFRVGVTTVVDAGCSGWKSFPVFKKQIIDKSQTRVLAFLNIVGVGMRGNPYEQDLNEMDPKATAEFAKNNATDIVGIKLAHFEGPNWTPTDRAEEAAKLAGIPLMVDFGVSKPPLPIEELFMKHMRPGDIYTHCFVQLGSLIPAGTRENIVDIQTKQVRPFVWEAQRKGIVFDVGYGGSSFAFSQAIPAFKSGFFPNTISTDLHIGSMNGAMKDMLLCMTKCMAIGMNLQSVIKASTWTPAQAIHRPELGNLSVGSPADVAILGIRKGKFGLFDLTGYKLETDKKLECEMTIRNGRIVYDLNGIADPIFLQGR